MFKWIPQVSLCVIISFLLVTSVVQAESYYASIETISVSDGLPDTTVYSIAKDKAGFLWLGMPTALARFDGHHFRTFTKNGDSGHQLAVASSGNIFIDSQQRIWIGTWGDGLALYNHKMQLINQYVNDPNDPNSLGSNMVQVIFEDRQGDIWIGTNGGGLALYQSATTDFKSFRVDATDKSSISHNRIWSITQTANGLIWVATSDGLNKLDKNKLGQFTRYQQDPLDSHSLDHVLVRSVLADENNLWVGTETGFSHFNTTSGQFDKIELFGSITGAAITKITKDTRGGIWVGTQKGLFRYDVEKKALTPLSSESKVQLFPHNDIRDLSIDDSGILWVATRYAGLIKINLTSNNFSYYQKYSGNGRSDNAINKVYAMQTDLKNGLWLGIGDGLLHMDMTDKKLTRYNTDEAYSQQRINALAQSPNGRLWLGGPFGLASLDEGQPIKDQMAILAQINIKHVLNLLVDRRGDLWIGTSHEGLLRYSAQGEITLFKNDFGNADSISGNSITALFEDQLGRLWIGTNGNGVNRYDEAHQRFVKYLSDTRDPSSLSNNVVNTIYQTKDSVMWFGTPKSLDSLDDSSGKFDHFDDKSGIANSNIKAIIEDDFNDLWISTGKGLTQFKRELNHFFNYTDKDSLHSNEFLLRSVSNNADNKLYFGNNNGFHEVQPTQVKVNTHIPTVVITDIWVDNKSMDNYAFNEQLPLQLDHQVKNIRLRFTALDFQAPSKNQYRYTLGGFDEQWSEPSNDRAVTYTSLDPGTYIFEVKGSNNSNQWNPKSTQLKIIISSPWWSLWWVRLLFVVLLGGLVYGWNRNRLMKMALQKSALEREVSLRTREIRQQKDELQEAHQQLNERSKALKETNEELSLTLKRTAQYQGQLVEKEKMAALGKMVAGISHEINTPIGLGVTATTLMQDRMTDIKKIFDDKKLTANKLEKYLLEGAESLDIIYRNLARAADLISSFKSVSVDQSSDDQRVFAPYKLIEEVLTSLKPELKRVSHQVVVNCDENIKIKSKPGAISQILINLISNSLIHAFDDIKNGTMTINLTVKGDNCELTYLDDGHGVSAAIEQRIFEPFATTKRGEGGSGLGMHLVYNLTTQALAGSIALNSQAEQGIEVKLIFPIATRKKERKPIQTLLDEPSE